MKILNERTAGTISFGSIRILPVRAIVIEDVLLTDRSPYGPGADTVLSVGTLSAKFSIRGLLKGDAILLSDVNLKEGMFCLATEPLDSVGNIFNIARIFSSGKPPKEKKAKRERELFRASNVSIDGLRFKMLNFSKPVDSIARTINWTDLDVRDISLRAEGVKLKGVTVTGNVRELSFREKSGFTALHMSGNVKNGNGETLIRDLVIRTPDSDINMSRFRMSFESMASLGNFLEEVRIEADILPSVVDFEDIAYFAEALRPMDFRARIEGRYDGYVNDFSLSNFNLHMADGRSNFSTTIDGHLTGLPDSQGMMLDARLKDTRFTPGEIASFIRGFAPASDIDLSQIAPGHRFHLTASAKGPVNRLSVKGMAIMDNLSARGRTIASSANLSGGSADIDIVLRNLLYPGRPIEIGGHVSTTGLDLGAILGSPLLGPCSMETVADVTLTPGIPRIKLDTLGIGSLHLNGYDYKDISISGSTAPDRIEAVLESRDTAFTASLGVFCATVGDTRMLTGHGEVSHADLAAMNIKPGEPSAVSFTVSASLLGQGDNESRGDILFDSVILEDSLGQHGIGGIDLSFVDSGEGTNSLTIDSRFLQASFTGTRFLGDFAKDLQNATLRETMPHYFGQREEDAPGGAYRVSLTVLDAKDVLGFFQKGMYIENGTSITLALDGDALESHISSGRIALKDKYIKGISANIDNSTGPLAGNILSSEISAGALDLRNGLLRFSTEGNGILLKLSYDNSTEETNKGEINIAGEIGRNSGGKMLLVGETLPGEIHLNGERWAISPATFLIDGSDVGIDSLVLRGSGQSVSVDGGISATRTDTISVRLDRFDIAAANAFMPSGMSLGGSATGFASAVSGPGQERSILMGISIEGTSVGDTHLGRIDIASAWNPETEAFDLGLRNTVGGTYSFMARGAYKPSTKGIRGNVYFNRFDIGFAAPLLEGVFSETDGLLSGGIRIGGTTALPELSSEELRLDEGLLRIDFTNVPYSATGPLHIDNGGVHFDGIAISDRHGGSGTLGGSILWDRLKDMRMGVKADFRGMEVLDLPANRANGFYGNIFATGTVSIDGPFNALTLSADATTAKEGELHVPLSGGGTVATSNLLTFVSFAEEEKVTDPYEEMLGRLEHPEGKAGSDMRVRLRARVSENTAAYIELDKESGNTIYARGNGTIDIDVRPSRDVMDFSGRYNISSGNFHLDALGIATRDFRLTDDSYINFNGDILGSMLEIGAVYRTKAPLGALIGDNSSSVRRNIDCKLSVTGDLHSPQIGFGIDIPDLDPGTQSLVESALSTQDKVQKQFLSLLISGSFLSDDKSGIVNNANMLNTTLSEIMMGQLNSILQKLDISLDLGLDFETDQNGQSLYDIAVSTELFNNRVIVNGTIGNRLYNTTSSQSELFGDLDIEIKIDKAGALRLTLFSHSADQYTSYLDETQRNGVGITYQKDLKSFRDIFKGIFRRKKDASGETMPQQEEMHKITIEKQ